MDESMEQETQGKTANSINNQNNIQTHDSQLLRLESEGETMTEEIHHTTEILRLKSGYSQHASL